MFVLRESVQVEDPILPQRLQEDTDDQTKHKNF